MSACSRKSSAPLPAPNLKPEAIITDDVIAPALFEFLRGSR
jgi:hypothetical protein